jgi:hypothetical protein
MSVWSVLNGTHEKTYDVSFYFEQVFLTNEVML